jgi:hypothetical protein
MSDSDSPSSQPSGFWPAAAGFIGTFAIFAIILAIVYLPSGGGVPSLSQPEETQVPQTPQARSAKLSEVTSAAQKAYTTYQVIDPATGRVRLPVDRAMELVIAEKGGN